MKHIVVFGAGKSATCLIEYLITIVQANNWQLTVADNNLALARSKTGDAPHTQAAAIDVENDTSRSSLITTASLVISLLPPSLHYLVAKDCVKLGKHLLTASYIDDRIAALAPQIENKGLLFLCEMGLDPGIDHMSAMQLIHRIKASGGHITSFKSHCGGLVAPENDNNPWHYKISWNPRNVVLAGKAGALFKEDGREIHLPYEQLFDPNRVVNIPELGFLAWYPNRDSLSYIPVYQLEETATFIRTTLRYPEFCFGWKNLIELKLTDETGQYQTDGMTLHQFFHQHFTAHKAAATVAGPMHEANLFMKQLRFLGMDDNNTQINKGTCSTADVLQFALENKLVLGQDDKDMIVMLHEITYETADGISNTISSTLIVKGQDQLHTAMAKTVGLPLGIAAKLILQEKIQLTGLHIPIISTIYEPVLEELEQHGITFIEHTA